MICNEVSNVIPRMGQWCQILYSLQFTSVFVHILAHSHVPIEEDGVGYDIVKHYTLDVKIIAIINKPLFTGTRAKVCGG